MDCVRADRAARGLPRAVVMGHAWVAGGAASESERDISVGGVGQVGAGLFEGVDYVALGHLHAPQMLSETVRYSGSPLAYSFGEARAAQGQLAGRPRRGRPGAACECVPAPGAAAAVEHSGPARGSADTTRRSPPSKITTSRSC